MALQSAPHPNAAQVLANFMVTRPGQAAAAGRAYLAALPGLDVSGVGFAQDVAPPDQNTLSPDNVNRYRQMWERLFHG
jgi:iron(III) transport system substrate-binding protein